MTRADRGIRRTSQLLADGEVLVTSVLAREAVGRRRSAVLVTDRRVIVAALRGDAVEQFPLEGSSCTYHHVGGLLTLRADDREAVVRDVDDIAGRSVVELLAARAARRDAHAAVRLTRQPVEAG